MAFSQMGFSVADIPTSWTYTKNTHSEAHVIEIGPNQKSLLSFRSETVSAKVNLENYVRQYLRDYNQYGFEVGQLQSRNQGLLVVVDLSQKNKSTQSRQVFFKKNGQLIIATCSDVSAEYAQTLETCNKILNKFSWK